MKYKKIKTSRQKIINTSKAIQTFLYLRWKNVQIQNDSYVKKSSKLNLNG